MKKSYVYLLTTFMLWGSLYVVSQFVLGKIPTFTVAMFRYLIAFIALSLISLKSEKEKIEKEGTEYLEELELLEKEFKQRTLDMKIKYGEIPVPEAARDRILSGIHQAKAEKERILSFQDIQRQAEASKQIKKEASADKKQAENHRQQQEIMTGKEQKKDIRKGQNSMKRYGIFKKTAAAAAAVLVTVGTLANASPITANAMENLPIIGALARVMTFRTFEDSQGSFEGKVDIPRIDSENGSEIAANQALEQYADSLIAMYENDLKESEGQGNYALESSYDVVFQNEKYISIRINTTVIMASGTQYVKVFTVNKATGEVVSLSSLLGGNKEQLEAISENIKQQMQAQMDADENIAYFLNSDLPDSDFKGITGEESYYFNENGELVISFDEYEVAPGYMGAVTFTIPLNVTGKLAE